MIEKLLEGIEIYQDILINGEIIIPGIRDCESRYKYIKKQIKNDDNKPFSILDIGANFGYYSLKLVEDFPNAFVTMVQCAPEEAVLKYICESNNKLNDRLCLLNLRLDISNLEILSKQGSFDYILCNNVLHHMGDYKLVYEKLKRMCKNLIIETPPIEDEKSIGQDKLKYLIEKVNDECSYKSEEKFARHTDSSTFSYFYIFRFQVPKDNKNMIEFNYLVNNTFKDLKCSFPNKK